MSPALSHLLRRYPLLRFAPPATGLRFARSLLAGLSAPPGAKPSAPPAELRLPPGWGIAPNSDAARVWRVSLPALQVGRFFAEHPPRGTRPARSGAGPGGTLSAVTVSALYFEATSVPAALTGAQVTVVLDPTGPKTTFVRVDAQVEL